MNGDWKDYVSALDLISTKYPIEQQNYEGWIIRIIHAMFSANLAETQVPMVVGMINHLTALNSWRQKEKQINGESQGFKEIANSISSDG